MKVYLLYFLLVIIGMIEYLPIPNMPNGIIEIVQKISFFTPWISIILIIGSLFFTGHKKTGYILLVVMLFVGLFPFKIRDISNRIIVIVNQKRAIQEITNPFTGTAMIKESNYVRFSWQLLPLDYEELIYQPKHGLSSDFSSREKTQVINEDWYISRTGRFE